MYLTVEGLLLPWTVIVYHLHAMENQGSAVVDIESGPKQGPYSYSWIDHEVLCWKWIYQSQSSAYFDGRLISSLANRTPIQVDVPS